MAATVTTTYPEPGIVAATWASLSTENGNGISCARWADKTVHKVSGTGTASIEGSNDGTNWGALHDAQGNALTAMANGTIELIAENPLHIRAVAAGGTAVVIIVGRQGY